MNEHSFLLVKPEGVELGLRGYAVPAIEEAGLRVVCTHELKMTKEQVERGWADYRRADHPLQHLIFDLWYAGRAVEVMLVQGSDVMRRLRAVKGALRRRFTLGPFGNMAHTPDTPFEFALQLRTFADGCPRCAAAVAAASVDRPISSLEGVPPVCTVGTLLPQAIRDYDLLAKWVVPLWRDPAGCFWRPGVPRPYSESAETSNHAVCLAVSPHQLSFDNMVGALLHVLPDIEPRTACEMVFTAMHYEEPPLIVGTWSRLDGCRRALEELGLAVVIRKFNAVVPRRAAFDGVRSA